MKELEELRNGLKDSRLMLVKERGGFLECSFVKEGLVKCIVVVEDGILAEALRQKVKSGIVEGIHLNTFRHEFNSFALHVKARKLYMELAFKLTMYPAPAPVEDVYQQEVDAAVA